MDSLPGSPPRLPHLAEVARQQRVAAREAGRAVAGEAEHQRVAGRRARCQPLQRPHDVVLRQLPEVMPLGHLTEGLTPIEITVFLEAKGICVPRSYSGVQSTRAKLPTADKQTCNTTVC